MTTEEDFQKRLNRSPRDWQTRRVLADWLEERGDPRAEGYRALGVLRLYPNRAHKMRGEGGRDHWWEAAGEVNHHPGALPNDWYDLLGAGSYVWWPPHGRRPFLSRREIEDAAALAFAKLPAERRAELLAVPVLT